MKNVDEQKPKPKFAINLGSSTVTEEKPKPKFAINLGGSANTVPATDKPKPTNKFAIKF